MDPWHFPPFMPASITLRASVSDCSLVINKKTHKMILSSLFHLVNIGDNSIVASHVDVPL